MPHQRLRHTAAQFGLVTVQLLVMSTQSASAGLLAPVLKLMQSQIEGRLSQACTSVLQEASDDFSQIGQWLESPCKGLAKPVSACLIREASRSGRELGVLSELISGQIGDDSEVVIRRCAAAFIGLPAHQGERLLPQLFERLRR